MGEDRHGDAPEGWHGTAVDAPRVRPWRRIAGGAAGLALIAGAALWFGREEIAGDVIDDYLAQNGIPATYDIVAIGPRVQVIENLVVGDPARPDLTARAVRVETGIGWTGPVVKRITIDGARVYATYRGGKFSLGALDPLIFTDSDEPPRLPDLLVSIRDGRGLVLTEFGAIGLKLEGEGRVDDGFAGKLAVTAPGIGSEACRAGRVTLYGRLTTDNGAPRLAGPMRLGDVTCGGASLARADIGTVLSMKRDLAAIEADFRAQGAGLAYGKVKAAGLEGTARVTLSGKGLAAAHNLALTNVATSQARIAQVAATGAWRGSADLARGQWEGEVRGRGLMPGSDLATNLAEGARGVEGTLLAPLLVKAGASLARAIRGASFRADATIRRRGGATTLIVPEAALSTRRGLRILAVSQVGANLGEGGVTGLRGNILAGGEGLPSINARMQQLPRGGWWARLAMADYAAGANRLAIPRLAIDADARGGVRFNGLVTASGILPGGGVEGLTVPLEGTWSRMQGFALGTRCTPVRFAALEFSGLALTGQAVTLCHEGAAPMLAYGEKLRIAARTGRIALAGRLGSSPAAMSADALVIRYPGPFALDNVKARIGSEGSTVHLAAARLDGTFGERIEGRFSGSAAQLDAVPFDLGALAGRWAYADGALQVSDAAFTLTDRPAEGPARFTPLAAQGASLRLADGAITAQALLRHAASGRTVAEVDIAHDLASTSGSARFTAPGLRFDERFQPEDLSYLAKGVIAFADGTITGDGRVDWADGKVTSGGTFASEGFDFAAAFGPVRGVKGAVRFTDLINLTTAPDQSLTVAAINPGVEVLDGRLRFAMSDGTRLALADARWPFMGGELRMRPLALDFGKAEERRYVFDIVGLDAARFVAQMELTNLSATGIFDGTVPVVFDEAGNGRIERGTLLSRGGGNVAYIGELTYENLGTMGNFAFEALRSLDYRQMSIGLNGNLAGEIVTNFDFDGVSQGAGTRQNFITRRLARLPIRFKVNVRSENFYELATMVRSFWDADYLRNPVDQGLIKVENGRFAPVRPDTRPEPVQPPESESKP